MKTTTSLFVIATLACVAASAQGESLDAKALVEIAKRHHLPMPPPDARLVLAHTESWSVLGKTSTSRDPGVYSPAYLLKEDADGSIHILRGAEYETLRTRHDQEPLWRPFSTEKVVPKLGGHVSRFAYLSAFVCAVQTAALDDQDRAQAVWQRVSEGGGELARRPIRREHFGAVEGSGTASGQMHI